MDSGKEESFAETRAALGGKARAEKLSGEQMSAIGKKGAAARWGVQATHAGKITIGDAVIECANLVDGRRVISERAMMRALGRGYSGHYSQRDAARKDAAVLPRYVAPDALKPFISAELTELLSNPVLYVSPQGGPVAHGVDAEVLPKVCEVWLAARDAGRLTKAQQRTAAKAEILIRGLARVGIAALIDQATGFQSIRDRGDLQRILEAYIAKELLPWAERFPTTFYEEMFRLRGWSYPPGENTGPRGPRYAGKLTNELVYERLPPGVLDDLRKKNPVVAKGRRKYHHHRLLTEDIGNPHLEKQVAVVTALMRVAGTWDEFKRLFKKAFPKKGEQMELIGADTEGDLD